MAIPFSQAAVAASQTAIALKTNVNDATSGSLNITGVPMPAAGSIVGISAVLTANKTAGNFNLTPTLNGSAITTPSTLVSVPIATSALKVSKLVDAQQIGARFNAGDLIGVKLTTDGSYAPTTNDLYVLVFVLFENVQF
jgi:hypothetical protein